jgi:hypothetical protein
MFQISVTLLATGQTAIGLWDTGQWAKLSLLQPFLDFSLFAPTPILLGCFQQQSSYDIFRSFCHHQQKQSWPTNRQHNFSTSRRTRTSNDTRASVMPSPDSLAREERENPSFVS